MENNNQSQPLPKQEPVRKTLRPIYWVIIILALVAAAVVVLYLSLPIYPVAPMPRPNPTAGWKTFTDEDYGYEFKYPGDWQISSGINAVVTLTDSSAYGEDRVDNPAIIFAPSTYVLSDYPQAITHPNNQGVQESYNKVTETPRVVNYTANLSDDTNCQYIIVSKILKNQICVSDISNVPGSDLSAILSTLEFGVLPNPGLITLSDWPGPNLEYTIQYPSSWDPSELSFPCPTGQYGPMSRLAVISKPRTNLPGFEGVSAAYLLEFCDDSNKATLAYSGFIKAPLYKLDNEDKITLPKSDLESTAEYQEFQLIIKSLKQNRYTN